MLDPAYDDLATLDGVCLAETVPKPAAPDPTT
jgi:hypothetical protein